MPKVIEITLELSIHKVSCPGVWLCQDGGVSLTVYALGTSYQTCVLPPVFPLMFKDVFYFKKRFNESCSLSNICCLLDGETIYCELVQWCDDCVAGECTMLAQYLGAMNDILFPPNLCSNEGVDLLMRRSKEFPGILSPKIEISTKVRIDEVWKNRNPPCVRSKTKVACDCVPGPESRQKQVCHSPMFHKSKCSHTRCSHPIPRACGRPISRSRSRSSGSRSCLDFEPVEETHCRPPVKCHHSSRPCSPRRPPRVCPQYNVYNVDVSDSTWPRNDRDSLTDFDKSIETDKCLSDARSQKTVIESRYIDGDTEKHPEPKKTYRLKLMPTPCVCHICKRYHELFHNRKS